MRSTLPAIHLSIEIPNRPNPNWMLTTFYTPMDVRLALITHHITIPIRAELAPVVMR